MVQYLVASVRPPGATRGATLPGRTEGLVGWGALWAWAHAAKASPIVMIRSSTLIAVVTPGKG